MYYKRGYWGIKDAATGYTKQGACVLKGNWDRAAVKSVFYTGLLLLLGIAALMFGDFPGPIETVRLFTTIALLSAFYLAFSVIGWLTIGLPVHWLCGRYTNGHLVFYATLPAILLILSLTYNGPWLLPSCALLQACLFRYYLHRG
ncbi:hypothetical protein CWC22_018905 [Pseudoalteromonas rubra]|uniref:Uncharacterized protein n=1 Tax=Pseudoalteromonas rubra TaxID=43658 RepID=A0A5S3UXE1_9GAMM|nr:hypothetical protein [Pseudoalteromonas rubra]QPB84941.1 hypothetical protein CWC22_018905 [Pseudoalteromonas rubra]